MKPLKRTVMALITSGADVLLVYHLNHKKWMGPGGHIEENETRREALQREILEETGLNLELEILKIDDRVTFVVTPLSSCEYNSAETREEDDTYWIQVSEGLRWAELGTDEKQELLWVPIDVALETMDLYEDTKMQLRDIQNRLRFTA